MKASLRLLLTYILSCLLSNSIYCFRSYFRSLINTRSHQILSLQSNGYNFASQLYELKTIGTENRNENDLMLRKQLRIIINEYVGDRKYPNLKMNSYSIGKAFISLQYFPIEQYVELQTIIKTLLYNIPDKRFDSRTIASILVGLKSSSCDNNAVNQVLKYVVNRINQNRTILEQGLDMKTFSMMMRAMKSYPIENVEIYQINEALCDALDTIGTNEENEGKEQVKDSNINQSRFRFATGEELASVMVGLSNRDSNHPLIRRLLVHIATFLQSSLYQPSKPSKMIESIQLIDLRERHIASILYSLKGVHLRPRMENSQANLSESDIKYELAVRSMLRSFTAVLHSYSGKLSAESIGTSLYGM